MEHTLRHRRVPGLAGLILEVLHCSLADLWEVCCFLRILVALLRFVCLMLPLVASRMLCNLSLHSWILVFHRRTLSVYDKVHLACLLATGCTLWILSWKTFYSPLFHSFDIPSFCDHFLDSYCPYTPRLLGYGSRSCRNCGTFSFDFHIYFICRPLGIAFACCCMRLLHLQICLLRP
jgi:hypothetical protein